MAEPALTKATYADLHSLPETMVNGLLNEKRAEILATAGRHGARNVRIDPSDHLGEIIPVVADI